MRIAMVVPPWIPVPPEGYGGIEWVASLLTEELVARGHEVTLFASGGSRTSAELIATFDVAPTEQMHRNIPDARHAGRFFREVIARSGTDRAFDVIHDHSATITLAAAGLLPVPIVHTVHGAFTEEMRHMYSEFADGVTFVAISEEQRRGLPTLPVKAVIPNAVDVEGMIFSEQKGEYLLCLGRVCSDKGQDVAVSIAKRVGRKLIIVGKVDPGDDGPAFFEEFLAPHIDGDTIVFEGEVSDARKRELISGAHAMLFPIRWPEPFGLVMIEAAASGTPVIATHWGAVPEVVNHGVTGFVCADEDEMIEALARVGEISPRACRDDALARFSPGLMADSYERVYAAAIASR